MLGEASGLLLGEDHGPVREDVELALAARFDLGLVLGLGVQLGRETRGPFVVAVSDGAVEDANLRHDENLPTPREPQRIAAGAGLPPAGGYCGEGALELTAPPAGSSYARTPPTTSRRGPTGEPGVPPCS